MHFMTILPQYIDAGHDAPFGNPEEDTPYQAQQPDDLLPEEFATLQIWIYATPVLLLTGTLGSLASVCVLLRPNIRKSTPMYFLTLLSFTDVVALWLGLLRLYVSRVHDFDIRNASNLSCKLHTFFVYFMLDLGSWLLALIAIERFLFIVFPHTARLQWNRTKATYAVIVVAVILTVVNGHYIFTTYLQQPCLVSDTVNLVSNSSILVSATTERFNLTEKIYNDKVIGKNFKALNNFLFNVSKTISASYNQFGNMSVRSRDNDEAPRCRNKPWSEHFHNKIFPWIDFLAFFFLPFFVMVITHVGIIRHVYLVNIRLRKPPQPVEISGRQRTVNAVPGKVQCISLEGRTKTTLDTEEANSTLDVAKGNKKRKNRRDKTQQSKVAGVSLMLISVLVSFAVTTCPITVFVILGLLQSDSPNQMREEHATQELQWVIVNMIQYTNNASHFFLFILTSKGFRQELLQIFTDFYFNCRKLASACRKKSTTVVPISD